MEVMRLSELRKGMKFPDYEYTLRPDIIETYVKAVEETDPLYTDEDYARQGPFGARIVPPTTIAIYVTPSQVFKDIGKKPPSGMIQTAQKFEFLYPVTIGETVTARASIDDIYQKKGRNYVVMKADAYNKKGDRVASSYLTFIWPAES